MRLLVDVRTAPGSRRHPHVARAELEQWLPAAGIAYRWEKDLGGFRTAARRTRRTWSGGSRCSAGTRAGCGRSRSGPRWTGSLAAGDGTVVMCSESVWWRCHRRLIADAAVLLHGVPVEHLMHDGRLPPHRPTRGRPGDAGGLVYDDGALPL